jgi:cytochrome c oxidase subunit 1/cytochrome c oxidase subunit I+III
MYHERAGQLSFWLAFVGTALTFFPMHIVGLLGMPRRQYTYPSGLGWTGYNLIESIGAYVLAAGLLLVVANLAVSLFKGAVAGNDPFGGATLEWSTTSPPPEYNYPVIPKVTSAYAMWDADDREEDLRRLSRGELVLEEGHETPASSVLDADWDEILEMPSSSAWPITLAAMLTGITVMVLGAHTIAVAVFAGLAALALLAWHSKEPQEA